MMANESDVNKPELTTDEINDKRLANLKPFRKREDITQEEYERQNALRAKGSLKRSENIRKAKSMKEDAIRLLSTTIAREDAVKLLGESVKYIPDDELNFQNLLLMSAYKIATEEGNAKLFEFLRDTSGQKPKEEIDLSANVMTDADRQMLAKLEKRTADLVILPNAEKAE